MSIHSVCRYPVGSVVDLKQLLSQLPDDIDGLEENYIITHYKNEDTQEQWLEIKPSN